MNRTLINRQANEKMKAYCQEHKITQCELSLSGCVPWLWLGFAHRHKRRYYYGQERWLHHPNQFLLACGKCHEKIEYDRELTESVFTKLRGKDLLPSRVL